MVAPWIQHHEELQTQPVDWQVMLGTTQRWSWRELPIAIFEVCTVGEDVDRTYAAVGRGVAQLEPGVEHGPVGAADHG